MGDGTLVTGISTAIMDVSVAETETYTTYMSSTLNTTMSSLNTTDLPLRPLTYYNLDFKIIATIAYIILGAAAIIGNVMVMAVVLRVSHMRTPTNCYLVSLALADAIVGAITIFMHSVPENFLPKGTFLYGRAGCLIIIFLEYLAFNVSALSITAFTVERYIAICHPMKAHIICSVSRATKIIIAIWVFEIAYSMQWFFLLGYQEEEFIGGVTYGKCWYNPAKNKYIHAIYIVDFFLYYMIPVGVCIPLYAIIGRVLFRSTVPQNGIRRGYEVGSRDKDKENGATTKLRLMRSNEGSDGSNSPRRCKDSGSTAVSGRKQVHGHF